MDKLSNVVVQYLRPLTLLLPLTTLPWAARRDRWTRFALVVSFLFILLLLPDIYVSPHYIAVYFPVSYVLLLMAIRQLRSWTWRGRRIGRALVRLVAVSYLWSAIGAFAGQVRQHHVFGDKGWSAARAHILSRLRDRAGDHLVVVRYSPSHNLHAEWVYNEADIDHSRVVWAHEMEGKSNNELFHYFRGRFLWLLFADASPARLVPYPVNRPNQDK